MSTVLVTGANRGLGLEFAKQYAADGWEVLATARDLERSKELFDLQKEFPNLHPSLLEIALEESVQVLADSNSARYCLRRLVIALILP